MRFISLFKIGFHYVSLVSLELTMLTRLFSNLQQSFGHCFLSAEITGVQCYTSL